MFHYLSVLALLLLAPLNRPVEEHAIIGPFPEKYQCEVDKAQVADLVDSTINAEIKKAKCIEQAES